ncbi:hypothetical protein BKP42_53410 [Rhodococcus erythropolis]|nr:hypothetical protein BKP42_53410 [Rhodococcus erythropolis]
MVFTVDYAFLKSPLVVVPTNDDIEILTHLADE